MINGKEVALVVVFYLSWLVGASGIEGLLRWWCAP